MSSRGLSREFSTTARRRSMVISSVWETSSFTTATVGAGVSTNPGGGTQVCAAVLPTVPIHAIEANRPIVTIRLIFRISDITMLGIYRGRALAVKPALDRTKDPT